MPIHDWTRVNAGIFHDFHHAWIEENKRALNRQLKGSDYYALAEQVAGGLGPDVLTLQQPQSGRKKGHKASAPHPSAAIALADTPPQLRYRITYVSKSHATK